MQLTGYLRLAFYAAEFGGITDKLINAATGWGGYSHVEFLFSNGLWFSASSKDGGTRFKTIQYVREQWELVDFPVAPQDELAVFHFCQGQLGKPYDWRGVFGFLTGGKSNKSKWFCSEIVCRGLQEIGYIRDVIDYRESPNSFRNLIRAIENVHS